MADCECALRARERPFSLVGAEGSTEQHHHARRGVGDAGERATSETDSATSGTDVQRKKLWNIFACGVPVKEYFAVLLPGLNRRTQSEVANLAPTGWPITVDLHRKVTLDIITGTDATAGGRSTTYFPFQPFFLFRVGTAFSEMPRAVKGAPAGAAKRTSTRRTFCENLASSDFSSAVRLSKLQLSAILLYTDQILFL
jgi:hypothetical protein